MAETVKFAQFGFEGKVSQQSIDELFGAHGLDPLNLPADYSVVKDKPAFVGDIMNWIVAQDGHPGFPGFGNMVLEGLTVDGDMAHGTAIMRDGDQPQSNPIKFHRIAGQWRLHIER